MTNPSQVPFVNLKAEYQELKSEIDAAMRDVVASGVFIQGPEVESLEKELTAFVGAGECISTASGTDAILIALMALGIGKGDEVITSPFSFFAAAEMIALLGAIPVFVDIDEATYNLDPRLLERAISKKCKAVIPVSLYGLPADMNAINRIAEKNNIPVIEDAAQSFGAEYFGKKSCNLSSLAITSFFPTKPLGAYGDAGAIFSSDPDLSQKMRLVMNHGQEKRYSHAVIGVNGRLDALQAAVLRVKLRHFSEFCRRRIALGNRYSKELEGLSLTLPHIPRDTSTVFAQYSIRVKNRESVVRKLAAEGVPTTVHYPEPVYRQKALEYLKVKSADFPVTEKVSGEILSLPMSAHLTREDQDRVVAALKKVLP